MSSIDFNAIANRLTTARLGSYLQATSDAVEPAIRLYDWNTSVSSALYEDLGRLEVVFRNAVDRALVRHGRSKAWPDVWYLRKQLFPGRNESRAREDIETAASAQLAGAGSLRFTARSSQSWVSDSGGTCAGIRT